MVALLRGRDGVEKTMTQEVVLREGERPERQVRAGIIAQTKHLQESERIEGEALEEM